MTRRVRRLVALAALACALAGPAEVGTGAEGERVTIVCRDTPVNEIFEMLARKERISIVVGQGVAGIVSVSLYDVSVADAVRGVAEAAGFVAEQRGEVFMIVARDDAGQLGADGSTRVRAWKIQYSDPEKVAEIVASHLSRWGAVTALKDRRMLIVEDRPDFLRRVDLILAEVDREPRQVLIEARVFEISLTEEDAFGIDWEHFFELGDGAGSVGVTGLAQAGNPGLFLEVLNSDVSVFLNALHEQRRVRTLATPALLALENQEAEVVIGDRLGFRVTTTINQVTTESIEFLESGVILRFKASVDRVGRMLLEVHPEVSTGVLTDGIPSQTTTEVSTHLIAKDGEQIFIGGLINDRKSDSRIGVPWLRRIPVLGPLFDGLDRTHTRTETVALISARLRSSTPTPVERERLEWTPDAERGMEQSGEQMRERLEDLLPADPDLAPPAAP